MTLHDAISQVLLEHKKPLRPTEIAGMLNKTS